MAEEIKRSEEMALEVTRRYKNDKEEAEDKTKRIKDLFVRLKQLEAENVEVDEMYA